MWPELLPPPMPAPHQKPYTLLVSLDDLLIGSTWDVSLVSLVSWHRRNITHVASTRLANGETAWCRLLPRLFIAILRNSNLHYSIPLCMYVLANFGVRDTEDYVPDCHANIG